MKRPKWIEVWIDSSSGEYVLLLRGFEDGRMEVVDPQEQYRVIEAFNDYADATLWMNEDEYDLVEGRHAL